MGLGLMGLGYFAYMIVKKLIKKVFVTNIYYQYIFLAFLIYVALIDKYPGNLFVLCFGGIVLLVTVAAIRSIYRSRYIVMNSSFSEVKSVIEGLGIDGDRNIYHFANGHQFRIRRNFEGVLIDFYQYSRDNEQNREDLFSAIRSSKIVRPQSWYVDIALSFTMCIFIFAFILTR